MTWPICYLTHQALIKSAVSRAVPMNIRGGVKIAPGMSVRSGPNRQVFPPGILPPEPIKAPAIVRLPDSLPKAPAAVRSVKARAKQPMPYQPSAISRLAPVADWILPVAGGSAITAGILGGTSSALNPALGHGSEPAMIQTRLLGDTGGRQ